MYLLDNLLPIPRTSGFAMEGYFVWCGSIIKVGTTYQLFASRWPESTGFPDGYRDYSEIVRAEAKCPEGPYTFQEVVIGKRDGDFWDSKMAHNPSIVRHGNTFVLYYIGSAKSSNLRTVGYATAASITGPWTRCDAPMALSRDANNPAPLVETNGNITLAYRDDHLHMGIAKANRYDTDYCTVNSDIIPHARLEDPFLYYRDGAYHIICEDNEGTLTGHVRWGVHLTSPNAVDWTTGDPLIAYDHTITWDDGETIQLERRERPQLLFDAAGNITHLVTGALYRGKSWCLIQPISSR